MRIVIAHDAIDTQGGVETYLGSILPTLAARGHDVLFLHHWRGRRAAALAPGSSAVCVESEGIEGALDRLRAWRPDVCFSHNMEPLSTERALLEWPVVKMMHGYFGTCISGLKTHAFPATCACTRSFGAACLALYAPRRCGQLSAPRMVNGYRWARDQRALFERYAAIVVASRHMEEEYVRNGAAKSRVHRVPLFSTLTLPPGQAPAPEADTVLFAGRMTSLKGGDVLIAAAARATQQLARPVRLLMAGDGPQRRAWQTLAASLKVSVECPGWIASSDRAALYRRAAVVAVPSLWPEPFGLIGLEAAALGIPAVAFDTGGIREWLEPGRSGILAEPADGAAGLADALVDVLRDPAERARLGARAREIAARMSAGAHVDGLEPILAASCAAPGAPMRHPALRAAAL